MNGKDLGSAFFAYIAEKKPPMIQGPGAYAIIYGDDEFVVDRDRSVLCFPDIGEVGFERDPENETFPQWLALVVAGDGEQEIVAGYFPPYSEEAKEVLPVNDGHFRALPYWVKKQMNEPRVKAMLEKYQARAGSGNAGAGKSRKLPLLERLRMKKAAKQDSAAQGPGAQVDQGRPQP